LDFEGAKSNKIEKKDLLDLICTHFDGLCGF